MRWAAALAALALPVAAQDLPALHDVTGVAANDVLNLRAGPSASAAPVGSLAPGARGVEVVGLSPDGAWARVSTGEGSAWAARRFLAPQPGAQPWWTLEGPLHCLGTEPFWSLTLPGIGREALFETPEPPPRRLTTTAVWPGQPHAPLAGVALAGGGVWVTATLTGTLCSDGMSDRDYGIAATLLMSGGPLGDGAPVTGCCTLSR